VRRWSVHANGRTLTGAPAGFALVERGPGPASLDTRLWRLACQAGAQFHFSAPVALADVPPGAIVATGLTEQTHRALHQPYEPVTAYCARVPGDGSDDRVGAAWFGPFSRDYGYAGTLGRLRYFMVFARGRRAPDVDEWRREVHRTTGVDLPDCVPFRGCVPARPWAPRVFANGWILAGSASGLIDPLFLFGVHGALLSGAIAATAVTRPGRAVAHMRHFARGLRWAGGMGWVWRRTQAWRLLRYPAAVWPLARLIGRTVPGYNASWIGPMAQWDLSG